MTQEQIAFGRLTGFTAKQWHHMSLMYRRSFDLGHVGRADKAILGWLNRLADEEFGTNIRFTGYSALGGDDWHISGDVSAEIAGPACVSISRRNSFVCPDIFWLWFADCMVVDYSYRADAFFRDVVRIARYLQAHTV